MTTHASTAEWRPWLRRKIVWLLAFKLVALVTLWLLFFSPAHRISVDDDVMSRQVAPGDPTAAEVVPSITNRTGPDDD